MASVANLTSGQDNVDRTSYTTASITVTSGRMAVASVMSSKGSSPDLPVLTGPAGVTWTQVPTDGTAAFSTAASPQKRVTMFTSSGSGTGTVLIDFTNTQTGAIWSFDEATPTTNPYSLVDQKSATADTATAVTVTLAGTAGDITISACATNSNAETITVPTGWTSLSENSHTTPNNRMEVAYILSYDAGADWTSAPTNKNLGAVSISLKETAAATTSLPFVRGKRTRHLLRF